MKARTARKIIPAFILTAGITAPVESVFAAPTGAPPAIAKTIKFSGSSVSTQWGPIQVSLVVKSKKITKVVVSSQSHTARSGILISRAVPILTQEVLQAQSASIDTVSGATDVSKAYIESLQYAITKARAAKALK